MVWFTGTSTGDRYTVGQSYSMAGDVYTAQSDGTFRNERTGRETVGSSQSWVQWGGGGGSLSGSGHVANAAVTAGAGAPVVVVVPGALPPRTSGVLPAGVTTGPGTPVAVTSPQSPVGAGSGVKTYDPLPVGGPRRDTKPTTAKSNPRVSDLEIRGPLAVYGPATAIPNKDPSAYPVPRLGGLPVPYDPFTSSGQDIEDFAGDDTPYAFLLSGAAAYMHMRTVAPLGSPVRTMLDAPLTLPYQVKQYDDYWKDHFTTIDREEGKHLEGAEYDAFVLKRVQETYGR